MILVAPDSFKGTYSATEVTEAIAAGVEESGLEADRCPVADGGEGTAEILGRALGGETLSAEVTGPLGEPQQARFVLNRDVAYIDLAEASGIGGLSREQLDPIRATTAGTGELMLAARAAGARHIFVAAGGSATVDGGAGAIQAIAEGGGLEGAEIAVLCDVEVPFERAPAVFGPQKGATPEIVRLLEARLDELAEGWPVDPRGLPMSGAAGGFSGGLWATLGARLLPGADFVLDSINFNARLRACKAVIAGEGGLDDQSFMGKILGRIRDRCREAGKPLHAVAGTVKLGNDEIERLELATVIEAGDPESLRRAGRTIGHTAQAVRP